MKKLLIVKTGTIFPAVAGQYGDFEGMIIRNAGIAPEDVIVAENLASLPDLKEIAAIIITGSHAMATDCGEWALQLMDWLREIRHKRIPTLGICYGHQLIAQAFGGTVAAHPHGTEIGTTEIELTEEGSQNRLLAILPDTFHAHVAHSQTVLTLPEDARNLASNAFEPHHAFAIDNHIWGVQFHPEFSADIIRAYIDQQKEELLAEGQSIEALQQNVADYPFGAWLLEHFLTISELPAAGSSQGWTLFSNVDSL
ncbi:MAG: glutamine amidotransferase [Bacillus sp. (in: firmicutes)]